jgi:hypothetical protein
VSDRLSSGAPLHCNDHPDVAAAAGCASCRRLLCDACFRFRVGGRPACARCAYEASTRPARRVSLAVSFLCITFGAGFWASRHERLVAHEPVLLGIGALCAILVAVFVAASGRHARPEIENRTPEDEGLDDDVLGGGASPYRAHARRVLLAASPPLSGTATALVVLASLAASAVLLPASVKLPPWIEAEIVLGLWWLIVAAALGVLLYRGFRVRDDFVYFVPWDRPAASSSRPAKAGSPLGGDWSSGCGGCSDVGVDGEGCVVALGMAVAFAVALGAAWVMVELLMPLVFFMMYWLFMRAIARASRDRRGCAGDLAKSVGWGALWATLYVLPIAALTWLFHALHRHG